MISYLNSSIPKISSVSLFLAKCIQLSPQTALVSAVALGCIAFATYSWYNYNKTHPFPDLSKCSSKEELFQLLKKGFLPARSENYFPSYRYSLAVPEKNVQTFHDSLEAKIKELKAIKDPKQEILFTICDFSKNEGTILLNIQQPQHLDQKFSKKSSFLSKSFIDFAKRLFYPFI